jgi:3-deoxy-D-manno-octulosonic-acid transferase
MTLSPLIHGYHVLTWALQPLAPRLLNRRLAAGKEDPARWVEKLGQPSASRPEGPLVWLHAASVGEALSTFELLRRLMEQRPGLSVLLTTGTRTSAELVSARAPRGVIHQFAPLDTPTAVAGFLDHWRPDLVLWTESELWPRQLTRLRRSGVPVLLINARLSRRSFSKWRWAPLAARAVLSCFKRIMAQDDETARHIARLGVSRRHIDVTGSLKEGAAPLPHDDLERKRLAAVFGGRPLWCAASTHAGEEEIVARAHASARRGLPGLTLILAPRHPERGDALAQMLRAEGFCVTQRSAGETPDRETEIYLADTLGEMGLWYRLAPVSFIGGSLVEVGGHNPFEPATLGSAILHGPHVANFAEGYQRLSKAGAALCIETADALAEQLAHALRPSTAAEMAAAAWDVSSDGAATTDHVLDVILTELEARLI